MFYLGAAAAMLLLLALLVAWGLAVGGAELSPLEALLLPALALLGAWSFAMWIVGSLLAFNGAVAAATLSFLLLAGWWRAHSDQPSQRLRQRRNLLLQSLRSLGPAEKCAALLVCAACAVSFVPLLSPPSGADYDSLVYHLAVPWQYIRAGRIVELPYDHHSYFPLGFEMLFAAPLSWFGLGATAAAPAPGAVAARVLHWAMLPASALLLVSAGSRLLQSRRAGWMAALVWCSIPLALIQASTTYIELGLCAWTLAAFYAAARALEAGASASHTRAWMWWSGAFSGAALGSKYLGAIYAGFVCAWLLISLLKRKQFAALCKPYAGAVSLMLLLGGGFYARNIAWTGSPVFPFAYNVFPARGWDADMAREYTRSQEAFGFGRSPLDLALLPWRLSMTPFNVGARPAQRPGQPLTAGLGAWPLTESPDDDAAHNGLFESLGGAATTVLSPLLLALGAPALLMKRKPAALKAWMIAVAVAWIFWSATGQYARYLMPALALWCLSCGWCAHRLLARPILKIGVASALAACCLASLGLCVLSQKSWDVALGRRQPGEWLASSFPGWKAMNWINLNTPSGDGVAVWGEPRCLYLDRKYFWADDPHNNLLDYGKLQDWPTLKAALKKEGASWILWNAKAGENGGFGGPSDEVAALIEQNATLKFEARGYRVYQLD